MAVKELYVGNLDYDIDLDEVTPLFAQYGTYHDARLVTKREGDGAYAYAFITMEERAADECIRCLHGEEFLGMTLLVQESGPNVEAARGAF